MEIAGNVRNFTGSTANIRLIALKREKRNGLMYPTKNSGKSLKNVRWEV